MDFQSILISIIIALGIVGLALTYSILRQLPEWNGYEMSTSELTKDTFLRSNKVTYRPEIDGLRAVAIVAVIINHFNKDLLPSGYLGVDIFFVISGYVITASLANRTYKNFGDFLLGFYTRRIKRLFPALILNVFLGSIAICLFHPAPMPSLETGIAALFGLSNLYLFGQATDYFAAPAELNIFTHTWSLGVEEQFYFLFPLLIWCLGFARKTIKGGRHLFLGVGGLLVTSIFTFIFFNQVNQSAAYFLMPSRFWELGSGCLLFLSLKNQRNFFCSVVYRTNPAFFICLLIATLFTPLRPLQLSVIATFSVVTLTILSIASMRPGTAINRLFTLPKIVFIGLISYSLYLWHWTVLVVSRLTIGIHWWSVPLQVSLMLLLAVSSYLYVERPLRVVEWSSVRWKSVCYGLLSSLLAALTVVGLKDSSTKLSLDRMFASDLNKRLQTYGTVGKAKDISCHHSNQVSKARMETCLLSKSKQAQYSKRIILIGDSHADHYVSALKQVLSDREIRSFTIGWWCGYISKRDITDISSSKINCSDYIDLVDKFILENLQRGDIILMSHSWENTRNYAHNYQAWSSLAQRIYAKNASLIILDDAAGLGVKDTLLCEKRLWRPFLHNSCTKSIVDISKDQHQLDAMGKSLVGYHYINLRHLYCSEDGRCGPYLKDNAVYSDGSHLSEFASLIGAKRIKQVILSISPPQNNNFKR
jgi:peptidoglycan/LPS O-acetylase OafA/YrhL